MDKAMYGRLVEMTSSQKKRALERVRKRQGLGKTYLVTVLIVIITAGVGWYVWSSSISPPATTPSNSGDFTIAAPAGVTIHAGSRITTIINVTAINGFAGTVHLSASASPSTGLTTSISPVNVTGSGKATLTMTSTANGTYTVTVTGTYGGLTHSVTPTVATPTYATLVTPNGTIVVELYRAQAPQTVVNFVNLANRGFYSNLVWHRIVAGFVIQTGDPTTANGGGNRSTWGQHGSAQTIPLEIDNSLHNNRGYLGMARSNDPNSARSQFYINLVNNSPLDGKYAVFGKVISGMDVADKIASVQVYTDQSSPLYDQPIQLQFLTSITIS